MTKVKTAVLAVALSGLIALATRDPGPWQDRLSADFHEIDENFPGDFGVYLTGAKLPEAITYQAEQTWYLSSATVILIAAAFFHKAEEGKFSEAERASGEKLLSQVFASGDSFAADQLIRKIGRHSLDAFVKLHLPKMGSLTDFKQVLRGVYAEAHRQARGLSNADLIELEKVPQEQRLEALARKLYVGRQSLRVVSIDDAFERYYERGANSVALSEFGQFIENLFNGRILSVPNTAVLAGMMEASPVDDFRTPQANRVNVRRSCSVTRMASANPDEKFVLALCAKGPGTAHDFKRLFDKVTRAVEKRVPPKGSRYFL